MGRDQRFAERSVVITGGGSGIGRVMSMRFAAEGAAVTVADIVEETAEETVALIEEAVGRGLAVRADVTDASAVDRMVEAATRAFGAVDVSSTTRSRRRATTPDRRRGVLAARRRRRSHERVSVHPRGAPGDDRAGRGTIVNVASVNGIGY